jgi:hypothetical protein
MLTVNRINTLIILQSDYFKELLFYHKNAKVETYEISPRKTHRLSIYIFYIIIIFIIIMIMMIMMIMMTMNHHHYYYYYFFFFRVIMTRFQ